MSRQGVLGRPVLFLIETSDGPRKFHHSSNRGSSGLKILFSRNFRRSIRTTDNSLRPINTRWIPPETLTPHSFKKRRPSLVSLSNSPRDFKNQPWDFVAFEFFGFSTPWKIRSPSSFLRFAWEIFKVNHSKISSPDLSM
jgi:hypothetical protein